MQTQADKGTVNIWQRNTGLAAFAISGACAISSGIVVSLLQERLGFPYGTTGVLLAFMNIGNFLAGFAAGLLTGKIGMKRAVAILAAGYALGYFLMAAGGRVWLLAAAFFLVGIGKGGTINTCTVLVGDNSPNRTRGMNIMHGGYALGALLCPFLVSWTAKVDSRLSAMLLGCCGLLLWLLFVAAPMEGVGGRKKKTGGGTEFLKSKKFWLLTGLIFCQNAAETSVVGWMVTYFKGSGILSGALSAYTVTVMWTATLVLRLLIAFVFPIKDTGSAMIKMGFCCTIFYIFLIMAKGPVSAIVLLFGFAASMAGMNPTAVASAGSMASVASMGVMLPLASVGAIVMPWAIGLVAQRAGITAGMACNVAPCVGMLWFSWAVRRLEHGKTGGVTAA